MGVTTQIATFATFFFLLVLGSTSFFFFRSPDSQCFQVAHEHNTGVVPVSVVITCTVEVGVFWGFFDQSISTPQPIK